ncbi:MAG: squalene/phytoene synthase family protein [Pirellulaceae bacterium]
MTTATESLKTLDMNSVPDFVDVSTADLEMGYKACRQIAKQHFSNWTWNILNLPGDERRGIDSLLFLIRQGIDLLDASSRSDTKVDPTGDLRDKLNDALCERFVSPEWATIQKTQQHFRIPKQLLFDFVSGLDHQIRFGQPKSYDEVLTRASLMGGSLFAAMVKIMGVHSDDYLVPAIKSGQLLLMTHWLAEVRNDARHHRAFLAKDDFANAECTLETLASSSFSKPVAHLVRLYTSRLEQRIRDTQELIPHLDFDCSRAVRGAISAAWKMLVKLQRYPEELFSVDGPMSRTELFALKAKYVLGIDGELPFELHDEHH